MAAFPEQGTVYFVRFPDERKERPAVIVSLNARNEFGNSVLLVPLTTNLRDAPTHVRLEAGEGGLPQASIARCENITTLPKALLARGPLGSSVSAAKMQQITQAILRALGGV